MKRRTENKGVNLKLVSNRGKAKYASEGSIYFSTNLFQNEMLDFERKCFQRLLEEEDTLFKMQDWEEKNKVRIR